MSFLFGVRVTPDEAARLDLADQAPAAFVVTQVPLGRQVVLWGHGMMDDPDPPDETDTWVPVAMDVAPHVPYGVINYLHTTTREVLGAGHDAPQMYRRAFRIPTV